MTSTHRVAAAIGLGCAGLVLVAPAAASAASSPSPTTPVRTATSVPLSDGRTTVSVAPMPSTPPTALPADGRLQVPAGRVEIHHGSAVWPAGVLAAGGAVLLAGAGAVVRRR